MRVGARASIRSGIGADTPRPVPVEDRAGLVARGPRHQHADLPQAVDRERVERVAEIGVETDGDAVQLQDPLHDLRLLVAPGPEDDRRRHALCASRSGSYPPAWKRVNHDGGNDDGAGCLAPGAVLPSALVPDDLRRPASQAGSRMKRLTDPSHLSRAATFILALLLLAVPLVHSGALFEPFSLPKEIAVLAAALLLGGIGIAARFRPEGAPSFVSAAHLSALALFACAALAVLPALNRSLALADLADLAAGKIG